LPRGATQRRCSPAGTVRGAVSRREDVRTDADLYVVAAAGGEVTRLLTRDGKDGESIDPQWSPDGARISFTTDTRGRQEVAVASYAARETSRGDHMTERILDEHGAVRPPDGGV